MFIFCPACISLHKSDTRFYVPLWDVSIIYTIPSCLVTGDLFCFCFIWNLISKSSCHFSLESKEALESLIALLLCNHEFLNFICLLLGFVF